MGGRPPPVVHCTIKRRPVQRPAVQRPSSCRPVVVPSCLLLSSSVLVPAVAVCRLSPAVLCCRRVVSSACRVLCCRVVSSVCWRLSCLPVAFAPFTFAPSFRPSRFHYSPSPNSSPCGKSLLVVPVVSILTFPALILQALSFFWQDYSLASY